MAKCSAPSAPSPSFGALAPRAVAQLGERWRKRRHRVGANAVCARSRPKHRFPVVPTSLPGSPGFAAHRSRAGRRVNAPVAAPALTHRRRRPSAGVHDGAPARAVLGAHNKKWLIRMRSTTHVVQLRRSSRRGQRPRHGRKRASVGPHPRRRQRCIGSIVHHHHVAIRALAQVRRKALALGVRSREQQCWVSSGKHAQVRSLRNGPNRSARLPSSTRLRQRQAD